MGDPKKLRKKYDPPKHPWQKDRIKEENRLISEYGLKNKREIWRAQAIVRKYHRIARELVGVSDEERKRPEGAMLGKLISLGLLKEGADIDDVFSFKLDDVLERRLQTIVWRNGLCPTAKQARQLIVHGHIAVKGQKSTSPGMMITTEQQESVEWYGKPVEIVNKKVVAAEMKQDEAIAKGATPAEKKDEKKPAKKTKASAAKAKPAKPAATSKPAAKAAKAKAAAKAAPKTQAPDTAGVTEKTQEKGK